MDEQRLMNRLEIIRYRLNKLAERDLEKEKALVAFYENAYEGTLMKLARLREETYD